MPEFQIDLHDDRTLSIDATDQGAALAGAQHFMEGNPISTRPGAAAAGAADAATLGFYDELRGYHEASDLPSWVDKVPFGGLVKAAGGAYNVLRDQTGDYAARYQQGRDIARQAFQTAEREHPGAYLGGQLAGGVASAATMPGGQVSREAGWAARASQAGLSGAAYGAGYGLGSGTDTEDRLRRAGIGAVTGGATGAIASPVVDLAGATAGAAGRYAGDVYRGVRGQPAISDEAARRVAQAVAAGPGLSASRSRPRQPGRPRFSTCRYRSGREGPCP